MSSARSYLNVYTPDAMAKTLALRDEQIDRLEAENAKAWGSRWTRLDPFELTKDPDGGGMTVRVKHGFVVLTREEERRVTESITALNAENAKLRELVQEVWRSCPVYEDDCKKCPHYTGESDEVWCDIPIRMIELGIEVEQ